jgi:hypothetical protein
MDKLTAFFTAIITTISSLFHPAPTIPPLPTSSPIVEVIPSPTATTSASRVATRSAVKKYDCKGPDGKIVIMKTREECATFNKAWNPNPTPMYDQSCVQKLMDDKKRCEEDVRKNFNKTTTNTSKNTIVLASILAEESLDKKKKEIEELMRMLQIKCTDVYNENMKKCELPLY